MGQLVHRSDLVQEELDNRALAGSADRSAPLPISTSASSVDRGPGVKSIDFAKSFFTELLGFAR
jgi:hypothetical protein